MCDGLIRLQRQYSAVFVVCGSVIKCEHPSTMCLEATKGKKLCSLYAMYCMLYHWPLVGCVYSSIILLEST